MRVVTGVLVAGLGLAFTASAAFAGSFDGRWVAEMPPQAKPCNTTVVMDLVVLGDTVMGRIEGHNSFSGTIDADGNGTVAFGKSVGTIHFSADRFEVNWVTPKCGQLQALGDRALTDEQQRQIAEQRRAYQARFAELVARADDGDRTVDYTALRGAYPFTEFWDPYGNKTDGLMREAEAAQKGGDCATALEKLDMAIKYDFTIDSAHALRSDCLKLGDGWNKAAAEAAIADGLIHSLMNSGDGAGEGTAYVVNTMREEMDVLANRHIQFRTRQTALRGSNGHYYDRVLGVSIRGGTPAAEERAVYFDVGSFVAGRRSRAAAVAEAAATIH